VAAKAEMPGAWPRRPRCPARGCEGRAPRRQAAKAGRPGAPPPPTSPHHLLRARTRTRRATSRGRAAEVWQQPSSVSRRLRSRARSVRPAAAAPGRGAWG